mmetsp:Transcript_13433/g.40736  ORF Transcript_13433/g.40736 Transcript_13433/m.40736 type:complete len:207 (-) Transcript_13433:1372-1992(-)
MATSSYARRSLAAARSTCSIHAAKCRPHWATSTSTLRRPSGPSRSHRPSPTPSSRSSVSPRLPQSSRRTLSPPACVSASWRALPSSMSAHPTRTAAATTPSTPCRCPALMPSSPTRSARRALRRATLPPRQSVRPRRTKRGSCRRPNGSSSTACSSTKRSRPPHRCAAPPRASHATRFQPMLPRSPRAPRSRRPGLPLRPRTTSAN